MFRRNKVTVVLKLALLTSHVDKYATALIVIFGKIRKLTSTLARPSLTCITNSTVSLLNVSNDLLCHL